MLVIKWYSNFIGFLVRQRIEQCVVCIKTSAIAEELVKAYTNHPGLFVLSLMLVASVLIPITIVSAIISIHIVLGVMVFITLEGKSMKVTHTILYNKFAC